MMLKNGMARHACVRLLALVFLMGILPWGCATLDSTIEPPHISLVNITPLSSDNLESAFRLDLRLINPNDRTFRIRGLECKLEINGSTIAAGVSDAATELPRLGTTVMPVTVYTSMTDFMWLMFRMISQQKSHREELKLAYTLRGNLFLDESLPGLGRLPFETEGDLIKLRPSKPPAQ
ncbi:MAG: LEA type 2 family protein [Desulfosarcina sp.]|nr:LEA type 2 family protein [Desulfobacterales bacterium]